MPLIERTNVLEKKQINEVDEKMLSNQTYMFKEKINKLQIELQERD